MEVVGTVTTDPYLKMMLVALEELTPLVVDEHTVCLNVELQGHRLWNQLILQRQDGADRVVIVGGRKGERLSGVPDYCQHRSEATRAEEIGEELLYQFLIHHRLDPAALGTQVAILAVHIAKRCAL
jgi:hypothetical protein